MNADDVALFNAATTVTVQDGRKASFWHSSWIEGRAPASLWPRLYAHSRKKNRTVRETFLNRRWVSDIAHNLNQDLLKEYFEFWIAIDRVRPALDEAGEDMIIWGLESLGQYSSKSAYMIQFAGQVQSPFPTLIWKAWAPPKCKFLLWLLLKTDYGPQHACNSVIGRITISAHYVKETLRQHTTYSLNVPTLD